MYKASLIRDSVLGYCDRHEISMEELAGKADVPAEDLYRIVKGEKARNVETADKIAKAMRCTLTEMLEKGVIK